MELTSVSLYGESVGALLKKEQSVCTEQTPAWHKKTKRGHESLGQGLTT